MCTIALSRFTRLSAGCLRGTHCCQLWPRFFCQFVRKVFSHWKQILILVLMNQIIVLKQGLAGWCVQVLFFQKMPGYILVVVNPKDYKNLLWPLAAVQMKSGRIRDQTPVSLCHVHRCRSSCTAVTLSGPWQLPWLPPLRWKRTSHTKSSHHQSPTTAPARGSRNCNSDSWCFYHTHFGKAAWNAETDCTYQ